jgi:hypothetical protein
LLSQLIAQTRVTGKLETGMVIDGPQGYSTSWPVFVEVSRAESTTLHCVVVNCAPDAAQPKTGESTDIAAILSEKILNTLLWIRTLQAVESYPPVHRGVACADGQDA